MNGSSKDESLASRIMEFGDISNMVAHNQNVASPDQKKSSVPSKAPAGQLPPRVDLPPPSFEGFIFKSPEHPPNIAFSGRTFLQRNLPTPLSPLKTKRDRPENFAADFTTESRSPTPPLSPTPPEQFSSCLDNTSSRNISPLVLEKALQDAYQSFASCPDDIPSESISPTITLEEQPQRPSSCPDNTPSESISPSIRQEALQDTQQSFASCTNDIPSESISPTVTLDKQPQRPSSCPDNTPSESVSPSIPQEALQDTQQSFASCTDDIPSEIISPTITVDEQPLRPSSCPDNTPSESMSPSIPQEALQDTQLSFASCADDIPSESISPTVTLDEQPQRPSSCPDNTPSESISPSIPQEALQDTQHSFASCTDDIPSESISPTVTLDKQPLRPSSCPDNTPSESMSPSIPQEALQDTQQSFASCTDDIPLESISPTVTLDEQPQRPSSCPDNTPSESVSPSIPQEALQDTQHSFASCTDDIPSESISPTITVDEQPLRPSSCPDNTPSESVSPSIPQEALQDTQHSFASCTDDIPSESISPTVTLDKQPLRPSSCPDNTPSESMSPSIPQEALQDTQQSFASCTDDIPSESISPTITVDEQPLRPSSCPDNTPSESISPSIPQEALQDAYQSFASCTENIPSESISPLILQTASQDTHQAFTSYSNEPPAHKKPVIPRFVGQKPVQQQFQQHPACRHNSPQITSNVPLSKPQIPPPITHPIHITNQNAPPTHVLAPFAVPNPSFGIDSNVRRATVRVDTALAPPISRTLAPVVTGPPFMPRPHPTHMVPWISSPPPSGACAIHSISTTFHVPVIMPHPKIVYTNRSREDIKSSHVEEQKKEVRSEGKLGTKVDVIKAAFQSNCIDSKSPLRFA